MQIVYEFVFPTDLCGMLIGKSGKNVHYIKERTGAEILLRRRQFDETMQDCAVIGTCSGVIVFRVFIKSSKFIIFSNGGSL